MIPPVMSHLPSPLRSLLAALAAAAMAVTVAAQQQRDYAFTDATNEVLTKISAAL